MTNSSCGLPFMVARRSFLADKAFGEAAGLRGRNRRLRERTSLDVIEIAELFRHAGDCRRTDFLLENSDPNAAAAGMESTDIRQVIANGYDAPVNAQAEVACAIVEDFAALQRVHVLKIPTKGTLIVGATASDETYHPAPDFPLRRSSAPSAVMNLTNPF